MVRTQSAPAPSAPGPAPVPAPSTRAAAKVPDAAPLYRAAVDGLHRAFADSEGSPELPMSGGEDAAKRRFAEPEWGPLVAQAAPALDVFAQAARLPGCDFGPAADPMEIGYTALQIPLWHLASLTAARGWQRLAAAAPGDAAQDAFTLLRHARHLGAEPSGFAAHVAFEVERSGLALVQGVLAAGVEAGEKVLERCRSELADHAERRAGRRQIVGNVRDEVHRMLAATVAAVQKAGAGAAGAAGQDELLRDRGETVLVRTEAIVAGWLEPLGVAGDIDLPAALASFDKKVAAARRDASPKTVRANIGRWPPERAVEATATMFALMLVPQVGDLLTNEAAARAELEACRGALGAPAAEPRK